MADKVLSGVISLTDQASTVLDDLTAKTISAKTAADAAASAWTGMGTDSSSAAAATVKSADETASAWTNAAAESNRAASNAKQAGSTTADAAKKSADGLKGVTQATKDAESRTRGWKEIIGDVATRGLPALRDAARDAGDSMRSSMASGASSMLGDLVSAQLIVEAIKGAVNMGKDLVMTGINYNAALEQSQVSWETILKDADKAQSTIADIQEIAATTPYTFLGIDKAARQLSLAKYEGEDLKTALIAIGDAVSAVGGGEQDLQTIAELFNRMATTGKVSAEYMNQFATRAIPSWEILSEKTGKSVAQLQEMSSKGQLMAKDVLPALVEGMGEKFGGSMEKQSKTWNGLWSTLEENWNAMLARFSRPIFDAVSPMIQTAINLLPEAEARAGNAWNELAAIFTGDSGEIAESFGWLIDAAGDMEGMMATAWSGIKWAVETAWTAVGPILKLLGEAIESLIGPAQFLWEHVLQPLTEGIAGAVGGVADWTADQLHGLRESGPAVTSPELLAWQANQGPQHASGTSWAPGGLSLVGEQGPELVWLPQGSRVESNQSSRQLMAGGSGSTIINVHINGVGAGAEELADTVARRIVSELENARRIS